MNPTSPVIYVDKQGKKHNGLVWHTNQKENEKMPRIKIAYVTNNGEQKNIWDIKHKTDQNETPLYDYWEKWNGNNNRSLDIGSLITYVGRDNIEYNGIISRFHKENKMDICINLYYMKKTHTSEITLFLKCGIFNESVKDVVYLHDISGYSFEFKKTDKTYKHIPQKQYWKIQK